MDPIRILIVDDNQSFRHGLRAMLRAVADLTVVGEAENGQIALRQAEALQPDVILMDLNMPEMSGLEATRRILDSSPHIRILVLTMANDDETVFAALRVGARGYLLKGALQAEMVRAIRGVYAGEAIFGPAIAIRLLTFFAQTKSAFPASPFPELTERELQILKFMTQGSSNEAIAQVLLISEKTVRNYVSSILTKLNVVDRGQAILRAREAGLE